MPKIVDHAKYRREIVVKATPIFSTHGFNGLGMRQIAAELGMSKSALYHYFPSKELLFAACTEFVFERDDTLAPADPKAATPREKVKALMGLFAELEKDFQSEAFLVLDYIRGKTPRDVARDQSMNLANQRYLEMTGAIVGSEDAARVFTFLLGALTQRLFDGRKTRLVDIEAWLTEAINRAR
jgi:TetR/AcrR family transcriptional regulator, transcriptional repressor of aconitase